MIKVFDLRTNKFLAPIPFSAGPTFARFNPNYTSSVVAASPDGALLMSDINDSSQIRAQFLQASLSGYVSALDFSSSGDMFAVGTNLLLF